MNRCRITGSTSLFTDPTANGGSFMRGQHLERDPIKCNRITLQIPLIVAQSFGEPLTLRRIAL